MQGKSGASHQIDLYWEFKIAGIKHCVAVECKDYNRAIGKDKIEAFKSVLDDLQDNVKGIFVSRKGYQKGAKAFAESYGIGLLEIREATEEDFEGKVREIKVVIHALFHTNMRVELIADKEWMEQHYPEASANMGFTALNIQTYIYNAQDGAMRSICDIQNKIPRNKPGKGYIYREHYEDAYLVYRDVQYKILEIKITYDVEESVEEICIRGNPCVTALVKNVASDESRLVNLTQRMGQEYRVLEKKHG